MARASRTDDTNDENELSFEDALSRLEHVVHELEDGDVELTTSLERYEEGVRLLRHCFQTLERAERRIEQLAAVDADGNSVIVPFGDDEAGDESLASKADRRSSRRSVKKKPGNRTRRAGDAPGGFTDDDATGDDDAGATLF
ncbi:MAG: exodeoxyribonuclease VII small subunit [Pirellulales bacterium]